MTDIDALAAGIHIASGAPPDTQPSRRDDVPDETWSDYGFAKALAATPPVAELLRLAAVGRAVERLPKDAVLKRKGDRWHVYLYRREAMMPHGWETAMANPDLRTAIENALEGE